MALRRVIRLFQSKSSLPPLHPRFPRSLISSSSAFSPSPLPLDPAFVDAPVSSISQVAHHVFSLVLDISSAPHLKFGHTRAGQFAPLRVGYSRPAFMSIASPPQHAAAGTLEFLVKYVKGQTAGLLCDLREGDRVSVGPISGTGFRVELLQHFDTILLFATGTGISPIRALIEGGGLQTYKRADVRLYYGCRNLQSMAYEERFKDWESKRIKIFPVFSQTDEFSIGKSGYIQSFFADENYIFDPLNTGAVLSGHQSMVQEVTSHLAAEGVPSERILTNF